jgi:hypothetical protein
MAGPPKDVPANELFLKLKERPRPSEVVDFPALDEPNKPGKIRIQVLSKEQQDRARIVAHDKLKKNAGKYGVLKLDLTDMASPAIAEVLSDIAACEALQMACRSVLPAPGYTEGDPGCQYLYVFPDGDSVGSTLSADEVAYLFSAYQMVQHKYGPHEAICSEQDVNDWVRRLTEGAASYPFLRLSSPQWAELLTMLAKRLYSLSGILEPKWDSLPESLRLELQTYCLGTGSSSEQPESTPGSSMQREQDGTVSFNEAMRLAQMFRKDR